MLNMFSKEPSRISDRVLKKLVVVLESHSARSVGVAGLTADVGADEIAEDLARMLSVFGRETLIICDDLADRSVGDDAMSETLVEVMDQRLSRTVVPFSDLSARKVKEDRSAPLAKLISEHDVSILSLTSIYQVDGKLSENIATLAPYCDIAFLVAQTAHHLDSEMETAATYCRLSKLNVVGLVLNDRQLYFRGLISNC